MIARSTPDDASDGFVPFAGEVQANVSPTAAARLDALEIPISTPSWKIARLAQLRSCLERWPMSLYRNPAQECGEVWNEAERRKRRNFQKSLNQIGRRVCVSSETWGKAQMRCDFRMY